MLAKTRRKIDMGARALLFSRSHPEGTHGYSIAVENLERLMARAEESAEQQLTGMLALRAATARRAGLRRTMRRTQMAHIARVARMASVEQPDLVHKFRLVREDVPYTVFFSAAQLLATEAQEWRTLLVRHGMSDTMLEGLVQALEEFEQVNHEINAAHLTHVRATAELRQVGSQIVRLVRAMDPLNRNRFVHNQELLASWLSASNVISRQPSVEDPSAAA